MVCPFFSPPLFLEKLRLIGTIRCPFERQLALVLSCGDTKFESDLTARQGEEDGVIYTIPRDDIGITESSYLVESASW